MRQNYNAMIYRYTDSCACDDSEYNYDMNAEVFIITYDYKIVNGTYNRCLLYKECVNMGCKLPDHKYEYTAYVLNGTCK